MGGNGLMQQVLAVEATVPDNVISSFQIDKHGTDLLICLKRILNVLRKQNDLVHGRIFVLKSSLFIWNQGVDYWFDMIKISRSRILERTQSREIGR